MHNSSTTVKSQNERWSITITHTNMLDRSSLLRCRSSASFLWAVSPIATAAKNKTSNFAVDSGIIVPIYIHNLVWGICISFVYKDRILACSYFSTYFLQLHELARCQLCITHIWIVLLSMVAVVYLLHWHSSVHQGVWFSLVVSRRKCTTVALESVAWVEIKCIIRRKKTITFFCFKYSLSWVLQEIRLVLMGDAPAEEGVQTFNRTTLCRSSAREIKHSQPLNQNAHPYQ